MPIDEINSGGRGVLADLAVQTSGLGAEFEHFTQYGDAALGGRGAQHIDHRFGCLGVGVVAIIQ